MDSRNENYLSMFYKVKQFHTDYAGQLDAALSSHAAQRSIFDAKLSAIELSAQAASSDLTGFAEAKSTAASNATNQIFLVGNACATYYTINPTTDPTMSAKVDWVQSELRSMRDSDLLVNGRATWLIANPIKALIEPFGVTAAQVDSLLAALDQYESFIQAPQAQRAYKAAFNAQLERQTTDMRDFLVNVLDQLMRPLKVSNALLADAYSGSRGVDDAPGGGGSSLTQVNLTIQTSMGAPVTGAEVFVSGVGFTPAPQISDSQGKASYEGLDIPTEINIQVTPLGGSRVDLGPFAIIQEELNDFILTLP